MKQASSLGDGHVGEYGSGAGMGRASQDTPSRVLPLGNGAQLCIWSSCNTGVTSLQLGARSIPLAWQYHIPRTAITHVTDPGLKQQKHAIRQLKSPGGQEEVQARLVPSDPVQEAPLRPPCRHPWCPSSLHVDAPLLLSSQAFSLCVCVQISPFKIKTKQLIQQID